MRTTYILMSALALSICYFPCGCSDNVSPHNCPVYFGFQALVSPDSLSLLVHLDPTWPIPDSVTIIRPDGVLHPSHISRGVLDLLAIEERVDSIIPGNYVAMLYYGTGHRDFEEDLRVRDDMVRYDFSSVAPTRGHDGVTLIPTLKWSLPSGCGSAATIYSDSLHVHEIWQTGSLSATLDSAVVPGGVLAPATKYFWQLVIMERPPSGMLTPCPDEGYLYWDIDNVIVCDAWFTTAPE